jgi:hypothetical protein
MINRFALQENIGTSAGCYKNEGKSEVTDFIIEQLYM